MGSTDHCTGWVELHSIYPVDCGMCGLSEGADEAYLDRRLWLEATAISFLAGHRSFSVIHPGGRQAFMASIWSSASEMEKAVVLIKLFVITCGVGFVAGSCRGS